MQFLEFSPGFASKIFKFKDPDTGYEYYAPNRKALLAHIESYRLQNELATIENIHQVVDNYLCNLPDNAGACRPCKLYRSLYGYIKGGIALLENIFYGEDNMVPQSIADNRAAQCLSCPNNQALDKGPFIAWSDQIAEASTGGKRSKYHDSLFNCSACNCPLRAKVFYKGPFKLSDKEKKDITSVKPDCWQIIPS